MKKVSHMVGSAFSTMSGHVLFVAKNSSVSVMVKDSEYNGSRVIPAPFLFPFETKIINAVSHEIDNQDELTL